VQAAAATKAAAAAKALAAKAATKRSAALMAVDALLVDAEKLSNSRPLEEQNSWEAKVRAHRLPAALQLLGWAGLSFRTLHCALLLVLSAAGELVSWPGRIFSCCCTLAGLHSCLPPRSLPNSLTLFWCTAARRFSSGTPPAADVAGGNGSLVMDYLRHFCMLHTLGANPLAGMTPCSVKRAKMADHKAATHPDYQTPFKDLPDAVNRLISYHVYQTLTEPDTFGSCPHLARLSHNIPHAHTPYAHIITAGCSHCA